MVRRATVWCAVAVSVVSCGRSTQEKAETAAPPPAVAAGAPPRWRPTTHPGRFDPGDLLDVGVIGLGTDGQVLPQPARVQSDGTIRLPLLNGPVPVAFADRAEATARIAEAYRKANVLNNAVITVRRLEVGDPAANVAPIGDYDLVRCELLAAGPTDKPIVSVERVDDRGQLAAPLLAPVRVSGLTEPAAAAAIAEAYRNANIMVAPQVSVLVLERAPADAAHKSLPDGPIDPVPPQLRELYPSESPNR